MVSKEKRLVANQTNICSVKSGVFVCRSRLGLTPLELENFVYKCSNDQLEVVDNSSISEMCCVPMLLLLRE